MRPDFILDVRKRGAAEISQLHHPAGNGDHRTVRGVDCGIRVLGLVTGEQAARLLDGRARLEVDAVGVDAAPTQCIDLAAALCEEIVGWHGRYLLRRDALRARDAPQRVAS